MALTLLQFWQQQRTIYQAERTQAQSDLAAAQARIAAAGRKLDGDPGAAPGPLRDGDQKTLANTGAEIAAKRAALAVAASPADASQLVADITVLIIKQRGQQGTVLDDLEESAMAQAEADAAAAAGARAAARLADIDAAIDAATAEDARRTRLKDAVAAPPLSTLKADAATFKASATVTNATTRVGKNFPAEIMTIADKRIGTRVNRLGSLQGSIDNAEDALGNEYAADGGLAGRAEQKRIAFERAEAALADYVATAASRYAQADVVMRMLDAIETAPPGQAADILTDPEKHDVRTSLAPAGAAAEPTAETLDSDMNGVFGAESQLDAQILTAISTDPDTAATDATVAAKRGAITAARNTFTGALGAFANKGDLDTWEAAIPDSAWKVLLDYERGIDALTDLSGITPSTLATAMDNAENDYATALQAAAVAERKLAMLAGEVARRHGRLDSAQGALGARLPSAIRGDSY